MREAEAMCEFIPEILFVMETSAKDNTNIENLFYSIATELKVNTLFIQMLTIRINFSIWFIFFFQRRHGSLNVDEDIDAPGITLAEGQPVNNCSGCKFL